MNDQKQAHDVGCPLSRDDLIRRESLEFALRTAKLASEPEIILHAAKAFEAYLKGE